MGALCGGRLDSNAPVYLGVAAAASAVRREPIVPRHQGLHWCDGMGRAVLDLGGEKRGGEKRGLSSCWYIVVVLEYW